MNNANMKFSVLNIPRYIIEKVTLFLLSISMLLKIKTLHDKPVIRKTILSTTQLFDNVVVEINASLSRFNSKYAQHLIGDETEQWAFGNDHVQLQSLNCRLCGGYQLSNSNIKCEYLKCHHISDL